MPPRFLLVVSFVFSVSLLNGQAVDLAAFRNLSDAQRYRFLGKFVHKKIPAEEAYLVVAQEFERMEKIGFDQFRDYHPDALLFRLGKFLWDLGDHEIANLLGVSPRSVYQTRWRLNKKMGDGDTTTT